MANNDNLIYLTTTDNTNISRDSFLLAALDNAELYAKFYGKSFGWDDNTVNSFSNNISKILPGFTTGNLKFKTDGSGSIEYYDDVFGSNGIDNTTAGRMAQYFNWLVPRLNTYDIDLDDSDEDSKKADKLKYSDYGLNYAFLAKTGKLSNESDLMDFIDNWTDVNRNLTPEGVLALQSSLNESIDWVHKNAENIDWTDSGYRDITDFDYQTNIMKELLKDGVTRDEAKRILGIENPIYSTLFSNYIKNSDGSYTKVVNPKEDTKNDFNSWYTNTYITPYTTTTFNEINTVPTTNSELKNVNIKLLSDNIPANSSPEDVKKLSDLYLVSTLKTLMDISNNESELTQEQLLQLLGALNFLLFLYLDGDKTRAVPLTNIDPGSNSWYYFPDLIELASAGYMFNNKLLTYLYDPINGKLRTIPISRLAEVIPELKTKLESIYNTTMNYNKVFSHKNGGILKAQLGTFMPLISDPTAAAIAKANKNPNASSLLNERLPNPELIPLTTNSPKSEKFENLNPTKADVYALLGLTNDLLEACLPGAAGAVPGAISAYSWFLYDKDKNGLLVAIPNAIGNTLLTTGSALGGDAFTDTLGLSRAFKAIKESKVLKKYSVPQIVKILTGTGMTVDMATQVVNGLHKVNLYLDETDELKKKQLLHDIVIDMSRIATTSAKGHGVSKRNKKKLTDSETTLTASNSLTAQSITTSPGITLTEYPNLNNDGIELIRKRFAKTKNKSSLTQFVNIPSKTLTPQQKNHMQNITDVDEYLNYLNGLLASNKLGGKLEYLKQLRYGK